MNNINKFRFVFAFLSIFTMLSCEKENIETKEEPIVKNSTDLTQPETLIPIAVSETHKFGKTIEEFKRARVKALEATGTWSAVGKAQVRAVGISDDKVDDVVKSQYFSDYHPPYPSSFWNCASVSLGPNSDQVYGGGNPWKSFSNAVLPKYRYYGEGAVSQNTGFGPWDNVESVNAQVRVNPKSIWAEIGGEVWITKGETVSNEFSISGSTAVTAGGKIKIPFVAEGESSVEISLGTSYTRSNERSFTENFYYPKINVAPRQSVRYVLEERWVPVTTTWKFPIEFTGNIAVGIFARLAGSGDGWSAPYLKNANAFNDDYNKPGKYHTAKVQERLSHEFRVAVYKIGSW